MPDDTGAAEDRSLTASDPSRERDESIQRLLAAERADEAEAEEHGTLSHAYGPDEAEMCDKEGQTVARLDAVTMPTDASVESPGEPEGEAQRQGQFGSLSAREAALRRWEQTRARKAAADDDEPEVAAEVRWVRVPIRVGEIVRKLNADAKKGSVQAAKELRAWLNDVATDEENRLSDLDRRTRQSLLDKLLADIEDERAEQGDEADRPSDPPTPATSGTPAR